MRDAGAAVAVFVLLALIWAAPASLSPSDTVPDVGDPLHLAWVMAWVAHQLPRDPAHLFDSNSFYPHRESLAFGDHLLPEALVVAPVNWLTGNAVLASNIAVLYALTASALAMWWLVRSLTGSAAAGCVAGLVYAFNGFTRGELLRVHVLNLQWWPLALLLLERFADSRRLRYALLLAAMLLLQGLSGSYYLLYTLLLAPVWLAVAYARRRRWPGRGECARLILAAALAGLVAAPVLLPYLGRYSGPLFEKPPAPGADLLAFVLPQGAAGDGAPQHARPFASELNHFPGFVTLGLALAGASRLRRGRTGPGVAAAYGVASVATGLAFALGPEVRIAGVPVAPGPYALLYRLVPVARAMASPERFGAVVLLGVALLAGAGAAWLLDARSRRVRLASTLVLLVLLPLQHWSAPRSFAVPAGPDRPAVYEWLARESRRPLVELPLYSSRFQRAWAAYLLFSTWHWRPIPIGRTSFYPPGHDYLAWSLEGFPDAVSLELLDRLGIHTVVVHPRGWPATIRGERMARLAAERRLVEVRRFDDVPPPRLAALRLGEEHVYRLRPRATKLPPPCQPRDEIPRDGWSVASTGNPASALRDGNPGSVWSTPGPQAPGDRIRIRLPSVEPLAAVALDLFPLPSEFGRNLALAIEDEPGRWRRLLPADGPSERWETLEALLRGAPGARMVLRVPRHRARGVRLVVSEPADPSDPALARLSWAWPHWSVSELRLYRRCE